MRCCNELGNYEYMIALPIPEHMKEINGGFYTSKTHVYIDLCLVEEIQNLWSKGIHTFGCCCGHGKQNGSVLVPKKQESEMLSMGYIENKLLRQKKPNHPCIDFITKTEHSEKEINIFLKKESEKL